MPLAKRRVACVDDDRDTGVMLARLLRREGCEVVTVSTLAEALEMSREKPFDLYVLDMWAVEGNGAVHCRRIREAAPDARIVVYSVASRKDDRQEALLAGANAFVEKPAGDKLAEVVMALVNFSPQDARGDSTDGKE